ncbi:Siphovirus Gp157 [uncultured Caudovirales phage]|uniref:Siphovirus Gp157 n=1 Tax=uncultured Caudovirales phage TaxID=2100421 RepID=A0A6J5S6K8_9CAUD|nr:Siphovirus Gp157 [uncultured Caudovirales phage]
MNIYQIANEYQLIINKVIELDGEITPEQEIELIINKNELEQKGINYAYVIKSLDSDCEAIDLELKRLQQLKKVRTNLAERLKDTISNAMNLYEVEKIETPLIKLSFRNSESVEITNESQLDACFIVTKMVTSPDKKAIKDAIKNGEVVTGATISYNKNLQIR